MTRGRILSRFDNLFSTFSFFLSLFSAKTVAVPRFFALYSKNTKSAGNSGIFLRNILYLYQKFSLGRRKV